MAQATIEVYCPDCLTLLTPTNDPDWHYCWRDRVEIHEDETR